MFLIAAALIMNKKPFQLLAAVALLTASPARALDLLTNQPPSTGNSGFSINNTNRQAAVGFDLPTGSNYDLKTIDLRLSGYVTTGGDDAQLQIYKDTARTSINPNGAVLQSLLTFTNSGSTSPALTIFTFTLDPTTPFTFEANTRYWLLLEANTGNFFWQLDANAFTSDVGVTSIGAVSSTDDGATYSILTPSPSFKITVAPGAVPAPTPVPFAFDGGLGLVALGGLGWLSVRRKKAVKASDPRDVG